MSQYPEGGAGPQDQRPGYGPGPEPFAPIGDFVPPHSDAPPTQTAFPLQQPVPPQDFMPPPPQPMPQYGAQPPAPGYGPGPGYPPQMYPGGYYGPPMMVPKTNGMAVAGMVIGILSLVLFWASLLGVLLAVLGIIFSSIGISQCNRTGQAGKGMAIAGLVCSLIAAAFWVAVVVIVASVLA